MSGLLDKKSRILDYIITDIGREEMTKCELTFAYAAFTDSAAIYKASDDFDHTNLLAFEATSLSSDEFITDLENNGLILSTDRTVNGSPGVQKQFANIDRTAPLTIVDFRSFITGAIEPLKAQFLLKNKQRFTDRDEFTITPLDIKFNILENSPFRSGNGIEDINALPNAFQDPDFQTKTNFKFLPPRTKLNKPVFDFDNMSVTNFVENADDALSNPDLQHVDINFNETSDENNILLQMF